MSIHDIEVGSGTYVPFEVRVTHLSGANKSFRVTDASCYCTTLTEVNDWVKHLQEKYSVPAERTFWKV